jgi:uncharacterized protein HemX
MLKTPLIWAFIAFGALGVLGGGIKWIRDDAVAEHQRRIDAATAKLQADAQVRAAENAAQSEREAAADETESAARDRRVEELTQRIAELEGRNAVCGTLSRDAVRALNTAR